MNSSSLAIRLGLLIGLIVSSGPADAQTTKAWRRTSSPIQLNADLVIPEGHSVTVEPGVHVQCGPFSITVSSGASFRAEGLEHQPVRFTALDPETGWNGFEFQAGSQGSFTCTLIDQARGGAIRGRDSKLTIHGCGIRNSLNFTGHHRGNGGAIRWIGGSVSVSESYFRGNSADSGGAIYLADATASIERSIFELNFSRLSGGALYAGPGTQLQVAAATFWRNQAERPGGAIASWNRARVRIESSIFRANRSNRGGAVYARYSDVTLDGCTLVRNRALAGSAMAVDRTARSQKLRVTHCIIWDSLGSHPIDPATGESYRIDYTCVPVSIAGRENHTDHPRFQNSELGDFSLNPKSPCRDRGSPRPRDRQAQQRQRDRVGNPRFHGRRDLGAYEWTPETIFDPAGKGVRNSDPTQLAQWIDRFESNRSYAGALDANRDNTIDLNDVTLRVANYFLLSR